MTLEKFVLVCNLMVKRDFQNSLKGMDRLLKDMVGFVRSKGQESVKTYINF